MKVINSKKGFTLIELLVAASIFVLVMGITVLTFFGASSYQRRLRNMRAVNQAARGIVEVISREVRNSYSGEDSTLPFLNIYPTNNCKDIAPGRASGIRIENTIKETDKCYFITDSIDGEWKVYEEDIAAGTPPSPIHSDEVEFLNINSFYIEGEAFREGNREWPYVDLYIKVNNKIFKGVKTDTEIEILTSVTPRNLNY